MAGRNKRRVGRVKARAWKDLDPKLAGRLAGVAVLVVLLGAILGPAILTTHPTPTFPDATQVAARPSSSPGPAATFGPIPSGDAWTDLEVPPFEQIADLAPNDGNNNGIALTTSFTLRSLTSTPAVDLARALRTDPAVQFTVNPGPTDDVALLQPTAGLTEGV